MNEDAIPICGLIRVEAILGHPITYTRIDAVDVTVGPGDYGHEGYILKGKKKVKIFISPLTVTAKPRVTFEYNKLVGGTMFVDNYEDRLVALKEVVNEILTTRIEELKLTLSSNK